MINNSPGLVPIFQNKIYLKRQNGYFDVLKNSSFFGKTFFAKYSSFLKIPSGDPAEQQE